MSAQDTAEGPRPARTESATGIGTELRAARERMGLTVNDLAARLRLEPRIVNVLEADEFSRLPAPAFVRGYLRALAKELGLDGAALIARFDAAGDRAAPALNDFESRAPLQITSSSNIVRYTSVAVGLTMVVLVALWWRSHSENFPILQQLSNEEPPPADPGPATPPLSYSFDIVTHPDDPIYRAPDAEPAPTSPVTPAPEPATAPAQASPSSAPLPSAAGTHGDDAHAAAPPDTGSAALPAGPGPSPSDIVLISSADAWIQVTDADGQRLYYNLLRPGREIRLGGRHPYQLVIGNAPAVRLRFAGQPVDLEPLARDGVAHLELGGNGPAAQEKVVDEQ